MPPIAREKFPLISQSQWSKETAYVLGFIWADGNLYNNSARVEIIKNDADAISDVFKLTGPWKVYTRKRNNWKEQSTLCANDKFLYNYLERLDYKNKSLISANKVLSVIPTELKRYWWRGYFDGDGNLYLNLRHSLYQTTIASSLEQDWEFAETLYNDLNVKYVIQRTQTTDSSHSRIRTSGKENLIKIGNYLYDEYESIGLKRKYDIYHSVLTMPNRRLHTPERKRNLQLKCSRAYIRIDPSTKDEKYYICISDASSDGFSKDMIRKCCTGVCATHKGFIWRAVD